MANGIIRIPTPVNEPVRAYAPGSAEKASLKKKLNEMLSHEIEIPLIIGGKEIRTGNTAKAVCPFDHKHVLANYHQAGAKEVAMAIEASQQAWKTWSEMPWTDRAAVFLKAADLLAGPWRDTCNAATMLNQAKTVHQAEIVCRSGASTPVYAACAVTEIALRVAGGFSLTRALPLERYFRDARGGLFQPPQDDLALMLVGRTALEAEKARSAGPT